MSTEEGDISLNYSNKCNIELYTNKCMYVFYIYTVT